MHRYQTEAGALSHRFSDPEYAAAARADRSTSADKRLAWLRGQIDAAERIARKYPEMAESIARKADAYRDEIARLERL